MKKIISVFLISLCFLLPVSAEENFFNSLAVLRHSNPLTVVTGENFDIVNIDFICGTEVDSIIINTIPSPDFAQIMYDKKPVYKNELFTREQINKLSVIQNSKGEESCQISYSYFSNGVKFDGVCVIHSEGNNTSPTCDDIFFTSYPNTEYTGKLIGKDENSNTLHYFVCEYPKNGILTFSDYKSGVFCYKGALNRSEDKFTYCAIDEYGRKSNIATAYITIESDNSTAFSDCPSSESVFAVKNGYLEPIAGRVFAPELSISRSEFLVNNMNISKLSNFGELENFCDDTTVFADTDRISKKAIGYVSYAANHNIIEAGEYFSPDKPITREEACGIMRKLYNISVTPQFCNFSDEADISQNYIEDVYTMYTIGALLPYHNRINPKGELIRKDYSVMAERLSSLYPQFFN